MTEPEPPQSDESARQSFIVGKLGDLYAESTKLTAMIERLMKIDAGRMSGGNRRLLYILIALDVVFMLILALHLLWSAGWFGG